MAVYQFTNTTHFKSLGAKSGHELAAWMASRMRQRVPGVTTRKCALRTIHLNCMLDDGRWEPITVVSQCLHRPALPAVMCQDHGRLPDMTNPA